MYRINVLLLLFLCAGAVFAKSPMTALIDSGLLDAAAEYYYGHIQAADLTAEDKKELEVEMQRCRTLQTSIIESSARQREREKRYSEAAELYKKLAARHKDDKQQTYQYRRKAVQMLVLEHKTEHSRATLFDALRKLSTEFPNEKDAEQLHFAAMDLAKESLLELTDEHIRIWKNDTFVQKLPAEVQRQYAMQKIKGGNKTEYPVTILRKLYQKNPADIETLQLLAANVSDINESLQLWMALEKQVPKQSPHWFAARNGIIESLDKLGRTAEAEEQRKLMKLLYTPRSL